MNTEPDQSSYRATILVVDDDAAIVYLLETMLKELGYAVDSYQNSLHAAEAFARDPARYDLVLTDRMMPWLSGIELAERVQQVRPGTPVVILSGYADDVDSMASREQLNIKRVLIKPVSMDTLDAEIQGVLDDFK